LVFTELLVGAARIVMRAGSGGTRFEEAGGNGVKRRHRISIIVLIVIALFVLLDVSARQLLTPNRIDLAGEHHFLLQSTWHQNEDYARFVELDDDAGCWATAIAQIAHYHRLIPTGKVEYRTSTGHPVSVDLDSYEFRHDQFALYLDDDTPGRVREQVGRYIYFIAAVLYTDFGAHGYLEHETFTERIETHLNSSVEFNEYDKESYLRDRGTIRSLVMREINAKRPIMLYFDNGKDFGHAAVLDGYADTDQAFLVHLNMGWGGRHDGWYDLFHAIIGIRDDLQTRFLVTIRPNRTNPDRETAG
jgi:hypothetical protein